MREWELEEIKMELKTILIYISLGLGLFAFIFSMGNEEQINNYNITNIYLNGTSGNFTGNESDPIFLNNNNTIWTAINNRTINGTVSFTDTDNQTLSYNPATDEITISMGNTIDISEVDTTGYDSLSDLQGAVSNDFHNLGGTDADSFALLECGDSEMIAYFEGGWICFPASNFLYSISFSDGSNNFEITSGEIYTFYGYDGIITQSDGENKKIDFYLDIDFLNQKIQENISPMLSTYRNKTDNSGLPIFNNISESSLKSAISGNLSEYMNSSDQRFNDTLSVMNVNTTSNIRKLGFKEYNQLIMTSNYQSVKGQLKRTISNMEFTVTAGTYYKFHYDIIFMSNDTTNGLALGVEFPSATVYSANIKIPSQASAGTDALWESIHATSNVTITSGAVLARETPYLATIEGIILPSASGVIHPIYSAELASCNITIKQGTYGWLQNISQ